MSHDLNRLRRLADLADAADWLRDERDQEIRTQRNLGASVIQIAEETGLTRQRVYQLLEEEGQ